MLADLRPPQLLLTLNLHLPIHCHLICIPNPHHLILKDPNLHCKDIPLLPLVDPHHLTHNPHLNPPLNPSLHMSWP